MINDETQTNSGKTTYYRLDLMGGEAKIVGVKIIKNQAPTCVGDHNLCLALKVSFFQKNQEDVPKLEPIDEQDFNKS